MGGEIKGLTREAWAWEAIYKVLFVKRCDTVGAGEDQEQ